MSASDFDDHFVTLRGGMIVPTAAVLLALDLERREIRLTRDGDALLAGPADQLTADDYVAIRQWKSHLLLLLDYQPDDAHRYDDRAHATRRPDRA